MSSKEVIETRTMHHLHHKQANLQKNNKFVVQTSNGKFLYLHDELEVEVMQDAEIQQKKEDFLKWERKEIRNFWRPILVFAFMFEFLILCFH